MNTPIVDLSAILYNATLVVTAFLLLKKIADMDRFHRLRVVVLTVILSCLAVYALLITMGLNEPVEPDYFEFEKTDWNTLAR